MDEVAAQARERWTIVDQRTNRPVTIIGFFSREQAEWQITDWQNRHDKGGRPDVSRDSLVNMRARLTADALPWGLPRPSALPSNQHPVSPVEEEQ